MVLLKLSRANSRRALDVSRECQRPSEPLRYARPVKCFCSVTATSIRQLECVGRYRQELTAVSTLQGSEQTWEGPAWLPGFHAPLNKLPCFERVRPTLTEPSSAIHAAD